MSTYHQVALYQLVCTLYKRNSKFCWQNIFARVISVTYLIAASPAPRDEADRAARRARGLGAAGVVLRVAALRGVLRHQRRRLTHDGLRRLQDT